MIFIIFLLGLVFGSFYNVVIYRLPEKKSIAYPPSHCGNCEHELKALDLMPVLSYVFLKGRCRYCDEKISIQYPLVELTTGLFFVFSYIQFGLTALMVKALILFSIILVMSMIDLKHFIIPDELSLLNFIIAIVFIFLVNEPSLKSAVYGGLLGFGLLFLIALIGPMGGGDIKIMAGFGIFLGFYPTVLAIMLSFILGGIIGVLLILFKIKDRKDPIPFGPFLGLGTLISFMYYQPIITWYFSLLR